MKRCARWTVCLWLLWIGTAHAQPAARVVDLPTRPGVIQRLLLLTPRDVKATAIFFAGGHGGLQLSADGAIRWGKGNFLVRTRQQFAEQGVMVVVIDAPSDRLGPRFLSGFRQTPEHTADVKAVIAWARAQSQRPVWLVGTSRGTQSAAFVAIQLDGPQGPDGLVLTSTILVEDKGRAVPRMALDKLRVPVFVVHHEQDGCNHCPYAGCPASWSVLPAYPGKNS